MSSHVAARPLLGGLTESTRRAAQARLEGRARGLASLLPFAGPAFVASVAYVDPGNFATNISAGAGYGYRLLWVVLLASLAAMLFQSLSAKVGIATGRNLAELAREHLPRPLSLAVWIGAEIAAMATDVAEFVGATLALTLIFHAPALVCATGTALAVYAVLALEKHGFRAVEAIIAGLVGALTIGYLVETVLARPSAPAIIHGSLVPWLGDSGSLFVSAGIIGATVMPHALFVHSSLTQGRILPADDSQRRTLLRFSNYEIWPALGIAALVNMAMMFVAAATLFPAHAGAGIPEAFRTLVTLLGPVAGLTFLASLLASGIASSAVGTMAGQVVMAGLAPFRIPLWLRRAITMLPSLGIIAVGLNLTGALIFSQVLLSLTLPLPMALLLYFSSSHKHMGPLVNKRITTTLAAALGAGILGLNVILVSQILLER